MTNLNVCLCVAASHAGVNVVLCEHSNTERGWLAELKEKLEAGLEGGEETFDIQISEKDRDPLYIV